MGERHETPAGMVALRWACLALSGMRLPGTDRRRECEESKLDNMTQSFSQLGLEKNAVVICN
jgi:hypothetical protein